MMSIITNPKERGRFLRFALVGGIGAVVDFGIANLLVHTFSARLVVAGTISFICAVLSNFMWNRFWTYPDSRTKSLFRQLFEFAVVSVAGLVIRIPVLHFLEPVITKAVTDLPFRFSILSPNVIADNVTLAIAVMIVMFWNFFVNRYWTYGDVK
jgi:putative flippase GtrA